MLIRQVSSLRAMFIWFLTMGILYSFNAAGSIASSLAEQTVTAAKNGNTAQSGMSLNQVVSLFSNSQMIQEQQNYITQLINDLLKINKSERSVEAQELWSYFNGRGIGQTPVGQSLLAALSALFTVNGMNNPSFTSNGLNFSGNSITNVPMGTNQTMFPSAPSTLATFGGMNGTLGSNFSQNSFSPTSPQFSQSFPNGSLFPPLNQNTGMYPLMPSQSFSDPSFGINSNNTMFPPYPQSFPNTGLFPNQTQIAYPSTLGGYNTGQNFMNGQFPTQAPLMNPGNIGLSGQNSVIGQGSPPMMSNPPSMISPPPIIDPSLANGDPNALQPQILTQDPSQMLGSTSMPPVTSLTDPSLLPADPSQALADPSLSTTIDPSLPVTSTSPSLGAPGIALGNPSASPISIATSTSTASAAPTQQSTFNVIDPTVPPTTMSNLVMQSSSNSSGLLSAVSSALQSPQSTEHIDFVTSFVDPRYRIVGGTLEKAGITLGTANNVLVANVGNGQTVTLQLTPAQLQQLQQVVKTNNTYQKDAAMLKAVSTILDTSTFAVAPQ